MANAVVACEESLNDFSPETRSEVLASLVAQLANSSLPETPLTGRVNTHLHTFFSYNYKNWSPTRILWEAKKAGLDVVGAVDFDVLDALPEWFAAGDALGLRTCLSLETRAYVEDYADKDINSPGEPGVLYFMGTGFAQMPAAGSVGAKGLAQLRERARARNVAMLERLQPILAPLTVDYDRDVETLSPNANATERHLLEALDVCAQKQFPESAARAGYWSERLGISPAETLGLFGDQAAFRTKIRAKLMKRGGPGYVQPDSQTFPPLSEVVRLIRDCGGVPTLAWLDGTSAGEADPLALLDYFVEQGCRVLAIIPDRNWNLADPELKQKKLANLAAIIKAAQARNLLLAIGTEMNGYGQKFVDDFSAPELAPYLDAFRAGAYALYGATLLARILEIGLGSEWEDLTFGTDHQAANEFYRRVGEKGFPVQAAKDALAIFEDEAVHEPEIILAALTDL